MLQMLLLLWTSGKYQEKIMIVKWLEVDGDFLQSGPVQSFELKFCDFPKQPSLFSKVGNFPKILLMKFVPVS